MLNSQLALPYVWDFLVLFSSQAYPDRIYIGISPSFPSHLVVHLTLSSASCGLPSLSPEFACLQLRRTAGPRGTMPKSIHCAVSKDDTMSAIRRPSRRPIRLRFDHLPIVCPPDTLSDKGSDIDGSHLALRRFNPSRLVDRVGDLRASRYDQTLSNVSPRFHGTPVENSRSTS